MAGANDIIPVAKEVTGTMREATGAAKDATRAAKEATMATKAAIHDTGPQSMPAGTLTKLRPRLAARLRRKHDN